MDEIKKMISQGRYIDAFEKAGELFENDSRRANELISLQARYAGNERLNRDMMISQDNYQISLAKITRCLLDLLSDVESEKSFCPAILFLTANPDNMDSLRFDKEINIVKERIQHYRVEKQYRFDSELGVRGDKIPEILLKYKPDILHISVHGTSEKGLFFQAEDMRKWPVTGSILAKILTSLRDDSGHSIRCVLLNACQSKDHAGSLQNVSDYTIGMDNDIPDKAACQFAYGFYTSLFSSKIQNFKQAFNAGINQIEICNLPKINDTSPPNHELPHLYIRDGQYGGQL